jgi:hypothetical protein
MLDMDVIEHNSNSKVDRFTAGKARSMGGFEFHSAVERSKKLFEQENYVEEAPII